MPNMKIIIQNHNANLLSKQPLLQHAQPVADKNQNARLMMLKKMLKKCLLEKVLSIEQQFHKNLHK